jgi:hypothetical protein
MRLTGSKPQSEAVDHAAADPFLSRSTRSLFVDVQRYVNRIPFSFGHPSQQRDGFLKHVVGSGLGSACQLTYLPYTSWALHDVFR